MLLHTEPNESTDFPLTFLQLIVNDIKLLHTLKSPGESSFIGTLCLDEIEATRMIGVLLS